MLHKIIILGGRKIDRLIEVILNIFFWAYNFMISNLGFCLELGLLNSETEIGTGVAALVA